ncbi:hypothetical protein AB0D59_48885 [Streptomyces sp. NPDC048417]|uniref:hypothetical protein n=1 Tax=Streptomyces sp. NPDC048417 TaxID=3155387 RepID=UPI00343167C0
MPRTRSRPASEVRGICGKGHRSRSESRFASETRPSWSSADRKTNPSWSSADRKTNPSWSSADRKTKPSWSSAERKTKPSWSSAERKVRGLARPHPHPR